MKKITAILILLILAGCQNPNFGGDIIVLDEKLKAKKEDIVFYKNFIPKQINKKTGLIKQKDEQIIYFYKSDKEVNKNIVFKEGNEFSNVEKIGNKLRIYGSQSFYRGEDGKIKLIDSATTTKSNWDNQYNSLISIARADTYAPESGDNGIYCAYSGAMLWQNCHDSSNGTFSGDAGSEWVGTIQVNVNTGYLQRYFVNFDLSAIDLTNVESGSIFVHTKSNNATSQSYAFYTGTQNEPIVADDYNNITTDLLTDIIAVSSIPANDYQEFVLTEAAVAALDEAVNEFVMREVLKDAANSAPSGTFNWVTLVEFYNSSRTGTDEDPYLELTFTEAVEASVPLNNIIYFTD